jgi:hypothetical protein
MKDSAFSLFSWVLMSKNLAMLISGGDSAGMKYGDIIGSASGPLPAASKNLCDEALFFENRKRFWFLTRAEETRWDAELVVDGHGDATFS